MLQSIVLSLKKDDLQHQNSKQNYFHDCLFCFAAILISIQLIYAW